MKRKCKCIALPVDQGDLVYFTDTKEWKYGKGEQRNRYAENSPHNLYIISDDEVQAGDWRMYIERDSVIYGQFEQHRGSHDAGPDWKKIIASTDQSLNLPTPSQDFIQKYCEIGEIDEVMVEYNEPVCKCDTIEKLDKCPFGSLEQCTAPNPNNDFYGLRPKVNRLNEISISRMKDTWTREEVVALVKKAIGVNGVKPGSSKQHLEDWISENL